MTKPFQTVWFLALLALGFPGCTLDFDTAFSNDASGKDASIDSFVDSSAGSGGVKGDASLDGKDGSNTGGSVAGSSGKSGSGGIAGGGGTSGTGGLAIGGGAGEGGVGGTAGAGGTTGQGGVGGTAGAGGTTGQGGVGGTAGSGGTTGQGGVGGTAGSGGTTGQGGVGGIAGSGGTTGQGGVGGIAGAGGTAGVGGTAGAGGTTGQGGVGGIAGAGGLAGQGGTGVGGSAGDGGSSGTGGTAGSPTCPLKAVQTGTGTFQAQGSSLNVTINPVVLARSFLLFSTRFSSETPSDSQISGELVSSTEVHFRRVSVGPEVTVRWHVAEFESCVSVQRGTTAITASQNSQSLSPPVDPTKSFPLISLRVGGAYYNADDLVRAKIVDASTLVLYGVPFSSSTVAWQVVSFDSAQVQSGDVSIPNSTTTGLASIQAVDPSKTWLLYSSEMVGYSSSDTPPVSSLATTGRLTSSTQLQFSRLGGVGNLALTWYAVSFTHGASVYSGTSSVFNDVTVPLSTVTASHSVVSAGGLYHRGGSTSDPGHDMGTASVLLSLLANPPGSSLTLSKPGTNVATITDWFVVDFP